LSQKLGNLSPKLGRKVALDFNSRFGGIETTVRVYVKYEIKNGVLLSHGISYHRMTVTRV